MSLMRNRNFEVWITLLILKVFSALEGALSDLTSSQLRVQK